ncbi:hypothetical protein CEUSTIGMA_g5955.t1 [Chlamydomonas eustigma]|uniref:Uncharacterized protein n=1 Tax=Chlamydomonas eustigma TaxID=1157962 RepID=A0A250X613_9CHLO|nr:hypothetical protein CEUSTIGMA_g5955.t1 [Chlamydomonas eustigma]|eukprot:GAX78515.1 hypothetical protein CEUSTIGMA_g5955.t1 [Chlamydomonas eustigma]
MIVSRSFRSITSTRGQTPIHITPRRSRIISQDIKICMHACTAIAFGFRTRLRHPSRLAAGGMDTMPVWTLDQIAGLAFGGLMVLFLTSANQVDVVVAKAQRRQLGICERCGGVNEPGSCNERECPLKQDVTDAKGGVTR